MTSQKMPSGYQSPKCSVTYGTIGHVEPDQQPRKEGPWAAIATQTFTHKVDITFPDESYGIIHQSLARLRDPPRYFRLVAKLGDILRGPFFTKFIQKSSVSMLSRGSASYDNTFTIQGGILNLYLDKESYERAGLTGTLNIPKTKDKFGLRWIVEYNLLHPSMQPGQKGYNRLLYASDSVLNQPLTWLYCDADGTSTISDATPLNLYNPVAIIASPLVTEISEVSRSALCVSDTVATCTGPSDLERTATDLYEWLSLIRLQSPRVLRHDTIDPYLSRYEVPGSTDSSDKVWRMSWKGLFAAAWLRDLLIEVLAVSSPQTWFAFSATGFSHTEMGGDTEVTLFRPGCAEGRYLMWEIKSR